MLSEETKQKQKKGETNNYYFAQKLVSKTEFSFFSSVTFAFDPFFLLKMFELCDDLALVDGVPIWCTWWKVVLFTMSSGSGRKKNLGL